MCRPIRFETDLFTGCAVIWVRGLPSAPPGLFEKRRRRTSITVQGRFRKPLALDDALSGQEFARPAVHLPAARLVDAILARVRPARRHRLRKLRNAFWYY